MLLCAICYHFVQFKKREKHPWRSVSFSKVAGFWPAALLKVKLLLGCFSRFLNCTNGNKSRKLSHLMLCNCKYPVLLNLKCLRELLLT